MFFLRVAYSCQTPLFTLSLCRPSFLRSLCPFSSLSNHVSARHFLIPTCVPAAPQVFFPTLVFRLALPSFNAVLTSLGFSRSLLDASGRKSPILIFFIYELVHFDLHIFPSWLSSFSRTSLSILPPLALIFPFASPPSFLVQPAIVFYVPDHFFPLVPFQAFLVFRSFQENFFSLCVLLRRRSRPDLFREGCGPQCLWIKLSPWGHSLWPEVAGKPFALLNYGHRTSFRH